ncbi:MAG: glycosyltransferase [Runella slithyformis]|nr:MAG: glycosyltransferase [Runella slithyformis]TAE96618.1 MAG: glycosyltransferase [Runella slithyformis]TAF28247.1 MAG: glycosyltransferase [Runella slithyformis]TAF46937.1 MAG: glycosyltransferase [Runella slithyformis]TAF83103.1 MAG: glycosyltransferase [Runella slithyformis]
MKISIVIPVYNSEQTIEKLVEKVLNVLHDWEIEIVLVNDGSRDASEQVCSQLAQRHNNVKFISLRRNFGEFNAVMCGLNHVNGDFCAIIDDDFQNPPAEILTLLETAQSKNYDVVYSYYDQKQHSLFRNVGSGLVNTLTTWLLDKPKDLYLSSFKLIKAEVVHEIIQYKGPYPYIDGLIFRVTRHIGKVKVSHQKRDNGASNYTIGKLISLFLNILFCYSPRPLRLLTLAGLSLFTISILLTLIELTTSLLSSHLPVTDHIVWITFLAVSGMQLTGMGMMGEYLGKLFMSQSGLPQYVIKSKQNV